MLKSFSLVIIRNEFKKRPDKFLLRYDERWECWLLPYYKNADVEALRQHLSDDLYIDANVIVSKGEQIVEKYGEPDYGTDQDWQHDEIAYYTRCIFFDPEYYVITFNEEGKAIYVREDLFVPLGG